MILRKVSDPRKEETIELTDIKDVEKLVKRYNEYLIFRIWKDDLEVVVFDGYVSHGKWNTPTQSAEQLDKIAKIAKLEDDLKESYRENGKLLNNLVGIRGAIERGHWSDKEFKYTVTKTPIEVKE